MATRRMFSKTIINSASFIKMPPSSQMLYFHLVLNSDDDGVVEAFTIIRMTGASEDDLKILVAKKFVTVLNEDLVTYINDWLDHNLIRSDRKINSKYKDLLVSVVQGVRLIEPRPRLDNDKRRKDGILRSSSGRPEGVLSPVKGQLRLGKDSIGKDSIGKDRDNIYKNNINNNIYNSRKIKSDIVYSSDFLIMWDIYPHGVDRGSKNQTFKNWNNLINQGITSVELISSAKNYQNFCSLKKITMIYKCSNFYGEKRYFENFITLKLKELPKEVSNEKQSTRKSKRIIDDCINELESSIIEN
jgi:hypothetical protein